ncbi:MARTX multifunctional-autoprocessing repeats-in-toxin holotoxin RtxA [Proteus mirabilis]|uniref:MARTX multifunctional-autoprocessing repeats-in-toxin holotoxin RtxA n=1 Tax=Proteus mirabilis TaxID=584 RepID=UPI001FADEF00|nr:MARTX multifunctional-autoprocessing repeats-in-toxin holotoxin RtxA [Proteus mirabilis]
MSKILKDLEFTFTGKRYGTDGNDDIDAIGFGGIIYAGKGHDTITVGTLAVTAYTGDGHDFVRGGSAYLKIIDENGDLDVRGLNAWGEIEKSGHGDLKYVGASAAIKINHTGYEYGNINYSGAAIANIITRKGAISNINYQGAGGYNQIWHETNTGNMTFKGGGGYNKLVRTWFNSYQNSKGNINFEGLGGGNGIFSRVETGDIKFTGGGLENVLIREGKSGDIFMYGAGANNRLTRISRNTDTYKETSGNIYFSGGGGYNHIYSNIAQGNITFYGAGAYNEIIRTTQVHPHNDLLVEYTKAENIFLTSAYMLNLDLDKSINFLTSDNKQNFESGKPVEVKAIKSLREPNTYLFKTPGPEDTNLFISDYGRRDYTFNKVKIYNDPETGKLQYDSELWRITPDSGDIRNIRFDKKNFEDTYNLSVVNNCWNTLEKQEIIESPRFTKINADSHYQLSNLKVFQHINTEQIQRKSLETIKLGVAQELFKDDNSAECSGDINFTGGGAGNVIKSDVTQGDINFTGGGIANVIKHNSNYGNTNFTGGGAANIIVKKGQRGDLTFDGGGLANVLLHQSKEGRMNINATGATNVLIRIGDGEYKAHLTALGNVSIHKGQGDSHITMLGGLNTHTQIDSHQRDKALWRALGGLNVMTQVGAGTITSLLGGGGNVLTKMGEGDLSSIMLGGANIITHISNNKIKSNTYTITLGGLNILTKKGQGDILAIMGGGGNVLTHIGNGNIHGVMLGGANILTKVGNGDLSGIMLGIGNVLTHVGDGQTLGIMGAVGNIFTKVGNGTSMGAMVGGGNIFTHIGNGEAWALMGGLGNVYTKIGNGNTLALMIAKGNVFTHVGDGMSVALMLAIGNIATKVGDGMTLAAMIGSANIFTHIGHEETFAAMVGKGNVLTKVGNGLTLGLMLGVANIYTHVGDGISIGLFSGKANIMTKVGNGTTLSAMFGKANIMTHIGDGITGILALGQANIITKVGDGIAGIIAGAKGNIVTHVGDGITAAILGGKANILTKVGDGLTVGLLISKVGNIMTHIGNSTTIGFAKGNANIITKVGYGLGINAAWGKANIFTHIGDGERYNFAKGNANIITKVGNGQETSVVKGNINIITHVGSGNNYTGAWGNGNVVTQIGDGRQVALAKGHANIVTMLGKGDNYGIVWGKANISTKVGNGTQVTIAKGQANITTTVGDGLGVTVTYGNANINTKVGNGVSVNVAWGKYNVSTKVGDGLNVSVMKGTANANIHVGNGLGINASYAKNNVIVKIGNGDIYSLSVASSNTQSNKLATFFGNIKQSVLGVVGSQAINYLVQGDDVTTSGSRKGKGAIHLIEKSSIDGFKMNKIDEVKSNIDINLKGHITEVETPSLSDVNTDESNLTNNSPNLIINGDFKHGFKPVTEGWNIAYTQDKITAISQYGHRASIDTPTNTNNKDYWDGGLIAEYKEEYEPNIAIYQDISGLMQNEVIELSFEYERQDNTPTENKLSVIWNGEVVFTSSSDDKSIAWQQQQIKLTANAENNRLIFTIPGSDGLQGNNYRLRNIVAKSAVANINKHISDSDATKNALADKKKADANRQKLTDEKQRLLDHISTTQTELESTDHLALEKNGHRERDAILEEANSVTHNLTTVGQTLEVLSEYSQDAPPSDQPWSEPFAEGILKDVQKSLINTKKIVSVPVNNIKTQYVANLTKVKKSIKKSEYGVIQSEEHCQEVQLDTSKAKNDADKRYSDAIDKKNSAQMAEKKASTMVEDARSRGDTEQKTATSISDKAQKEAKSVQLKESDKPNRHRAHGSGLSGEAAYVEGADDNPSSYIKPISTKKNDGRFNNKLTTFNQELLDDAQQAINRLSINAGIRQKSANVLPSFTSDLNGDDVATYQQPSLRSGNLQYHKIGAIAVNLSGLGESPIFETLKQKFNVKIKNRNTYFTFILEKNSGRIQKNIYLDNINDPTQQKIIEHFILANYSNFEAMPNELHLENDKIKSSHNNKDRILAEYVEHKWQMLTDSKVMSVDELHKVASVKGKIQGESYKSIITTLSEYHEKESNTNCLPIEKLRVLAQLRNQIDGYLLGHPDSERNDGLKQLQTQVNTRYKHASALIQDSHTINADSSFSRLYDSLSNANLKRSKHIYIDINGHFVTEGKNNLQGKNRLTSGKEVIERVKNAVEKEYGAPIANKVFSQFANNEFAENGEGIDVSGLKKIHRAIERELSPHSATLYIWKPSNHSNLGHATLQIGQGRLLLNTEDAQNNHKENYISWWPNKAKSYFDVMGVPSQPKESLASDVAAEENDGFGLNYKYKELNRYDRLMNIAKGETVTTADDLSLADAKNILTIPNYIENSKIPRTIGQPFIDEWVITQKKLNNIATNFLEAVQGKFSGNTITINGAMILLTEPTLLSKRKIPLSVAQPFIEQWDNIKTQQEDISIQLLKAMKTWIQEGKDPTLTKKRIALVENEFAEQKQKSIDRFKTSLPDEGRVFRINLEGLDVAAMQAEWQRIKNSPNGRYHLLTQNCSSIVAKILKAGGADELIGYNWQPKYNIWTPNQMFAFAQELQEAQMARQQSRMIPPNLHALSGSENIRQELENTSPLISAEQKLNIVFSEQETGFLLTQASDETNEKFIYIKNGDNQEQQKIMSNFILTHYRDFDSIPEQLYFLDNTIVSLDKNHSRILSEKVGENWQPVAYSNLMTADELTSAAEVTGKARGENYKAIIQSLRDYELQSTNTNNTPIDIFQQLSTLRIQINSYLLKHPDSKRNEALQQLRDQVDIRYKHASILLSNSQQVDSNNTFSYLYEIFSNANLKINKHIYLDENGNFVTKGKNNLQNQDKLISGKNAITSIKRLVEKEYGSEITNQVFNQFTENEFAQNGHGIDLSGLKKFTKQLNNKFHQSVLHYISGSPANIVAWDMLRYK